MNPYYRHRGNLLRSGGFFRKDLNLIERNGIKPPLSGSILPSGRSLSHHKVEPGIKNFDLHHEQRSCH